MDHYSAQRANAVERYVLGELPPAEAEEFELHYFECPQCALAVESGQLFVDNARAWFRNPTVPGESKVVEKKSSFLQTIAAFWRPGFAIPVMAALAVLALYQGAVVIPNLHKVLNSARYLPATQLIGASRGEDVVIRVPLASPFVALSGDIPPGTPYQRYICVLKRSASEVLTVETPAPAEGMPITVLIPLSKLKAGPQELDLYGEKPDGQRSDRISKYPFTVQFD